MPKKLLIQQNCVVAGGKIKERGDEYTPTNEQELYDLIRAGRALEVSDPDSKPVAVEIAEEKKSAAAAKSVASATVAPVAGATLAKPAAAATK